MREEPVPCRNATDYEIELGKHMTWEEGSVCPRCIHILDRFAQRKAISEAEQEDGSDVS